MKRITFCFLLSLWLLACSKTDSQPDTASESERPCGKAKSGQQLYTGPKGGCYYYNGNNNKTYVDRNECNC